MEPREEDSKIEISADASFAPGGKGLSTGVVVKLFGLVVHWAGVRQSLTALSSCEAELVAAVIG
eukprot:12308924-Prorocentrum_lima.AAC.1